MIYVELVLPEVCHNIISYLCLIFVLELIDYF